MKYIKPVTYFVYMDSIDLVTSHICDTGSEYDCQMKRYNCFVMLGSRDVKIFETYSLE